MIITMHSGADEGYTFCIILMKFDYLFKHRPITWRLSENFNLCTRADKRSGTNFFSNLFTLRLTVYDAIQANDLNFVLKGEFRMIFKI